MSEHIVKSVQAGSIAQECGFEPGDALLKINGQEIKDIFDYRFLSQDEFLVLEAKSSGGEIVEIEVEKDAEEDLGLEFENAFMDSYRSCKNKCIFCFIDQMPEGMRETLYFKDDDARLSFLQGNYVTLTNMSEEDVERIIQYHLEPINISFQTMNPKLRCEMLNNRFAGEALKKVDRFAQAGISMNGQIVLCRNINDGKELDYSIEQLLKYIPLLGSVSVVPSGLTKYREGLFPLEAFTKEDALRVIHQIHGWQAHCMSAYGIHFVHASDEWYLLAGLEVPSAEVYDGYLQLDNGVGMLRLFADEFHAALEDLKEEIVLNSSLKQLLVSVSPVSFATGKAAYGVLSQLVSELCEVVPELKVYGYQIENHFFGDNITVAGLVTGGDLLKQLKGESLGTRLLLPESMLRANEDVFLDDMCVSELESALQVEVDIVKSSGQEFLYHILGLRPVE